MKLAEKIHVAGRGDVITGQYENGDRVWQIGDVIRWEGHEWEVTNIERMLHLTCPPKPAPGFGLVVREIK